MTRQLLVVVDGIHKPATLECRVRLHFKIDGFITCPVWPALSRSGEVDTMVKVSRDVLDHAAVKAAR